MKEYNVVIYGEGDVPKGLNENKSYPLIFCKGCERQDCSILRQVLHSGRGYCDMAYQDGKYQVRKA
jgi:hypothetical protein